MPRLPVKRLNFLKPAALFSVHHKKVISVNILFRQYRPKPAGPL
jgi:hypothetical protein